MSTPLTEIARNNPRLLRPLELFADGKANCAQTVLMPFLENDPEQLRSVLLGSTQDLGGGVAGMGYVCGALLGAVMVLSRRLAERNVPDQERQDRIDRFVRQFGQRYSSPFCSGINGRDAGTEKAYETCRFLVVQTIDAVDAVLSDRD